MKNITKFAVSFVAVAALFVAADASAYTHMGTLKMGSTGSQVMELQKALNAKGFVVSSTGLGSAGNESTYFGAKTKAAVMAFQTANPSTGMADGIVGNNTGAALASGTSTGGTSTVPGCTAGAMFSSTTGAACTGTTTPTGPLAGTVGTIDYSLTTGLSNEEVGEEDSDVKVAGLELDLDDSDSDVQVTAIKLNFDVGTAGNDFEDYADEVSVWLGSTKVASVEADEFNDDNDFEKTVSLSNAVIRMGDTKDLYVAISGVSNLDTADVSDTWTVDFTLVRFTDAQGATTSEDPTETAVTFSFESFATATDAELKISEGDDSINDAHVINVDATDDTDNVEILSFNMEAEGDSDLTIDALPITLTSVEATGNDPDDLISIVYLFAGDTEIGSENLSTGDADGSTEVVVFDDLDYTIDAGEEEEFTVKAKFYSIADTLDSGDTLQATFGETETDLATFEVEDESGEELADGDKTGTVAGGAHGVYDVGIMAKYISSTATATPSGVATVDDNGTFTIVFDVSAFDSDIYVDGTAIADETGGATYQDIDASTTSVASGVLSCSGCADAANSTFKVAEGETERFTVTVAGSGADVFAMASLTSILYATTAIDGDTLYAFNMTDFKTNSVWLDSN